MSQPTCLIQQPKCGRIEGNPVCPKCSIDVRVRYVSEEARLLAIANATATYWKAHAKSLEEKPPVVSPPEQLKPPTPEPPKAPVQPQQASADNSVLAWLAVVLLLLGAVGRYLPDKQTAAPAEVVKAPVTAPAPTRCTDCPEMVVVPGGGFQMGSNDGDSNDDEKPAHRVNLKSFAIGKYEVTQGQWRAIMGSNPSHFANCGDNCPVDNVIWDDIQNYIQKLNKRTGQRYRLPTEAEWEYACRGGQQQKYCGSDTLDNVAWYKTNSANTNHPVGEKAPNGYGLHDMSGNVFEWVQDWHHNSYNGAPNDGSAWVTGGEQWQRVLRGGSWKNYDGDALVTYRGKSSPGGRYNSFGFRLASTVP